MAPDRSIENIFKEIQALEKEGNINLLILEVVKHYNNLRPYRPELMERVAFYLDNSILSPETIRALKSLPLVDLQNFFLSDKLNSFHITSPAPSCGRIYFPIIATRGQIYEIRIQKKRIKGFLPLKLELLDQVGAPVYSLLQDLLSWNLFWDPGQFSFQILDTFGREDSTVSGQSMALPLALALYSIETKKDLPPNLSATAAIKRDGSVEPVEGLKEKLATLRRERHFIDTVFVSKRQEINFAIRDLKIVKVDNLKDTINIAFPGPVDPSVFPAGIDVDVEISKINEQYDSYLIDTCLGNALRLTRYLEARDCPLSREERAKTLFVCYWRRGSCHCHKGQVELTKRNLDKANALYNKYKGIIRPHTYLNMKISHGVHLKDIFRYKEAEDLHKAINSEAENITGVDEEQAKNLSSLSQLYLAQRRFQEAVELQKKAISLFRKSERYRNHNYLALIYTRNSDFPMAARAFKQTLNLLVQADSDTHKKGLPFYHLYFSEYLYKSGMNQKRGVKQRLQELHEIADRYPDITWYVPALIHKFSGCAFLSEEEENKGLKTLEKVMQFFDSQFDAMHRLLGVTVRADRALYLLETFQIDEAADDIRSIRDSLSAQKDIKQFFNKEIMKIRDYLRFKYIKENQIQGMKKMLTIVKNKIPY